MTLGSRTRAVVRASTHSGRYCLPNLDMRSSRAEAHAIKQAKACDASGRRTRPVVQDAQLAAISAGRSPAAERMRLHRERRRQGLRCLMIELRETEIDVLIAKGLLNSETRHDPHIVRQALHAHLDRTLGSIS
jgi:hypothetical protein